MIDPLRLRVVQMKEQYGLPMLRGEVEDHTAQIKSAIFLFKAKYQSQNHEHKAELEHNEEPSLSPSERLRANLSSRNAGRT